MSFTDPLFDVFACPHLACFVAQGTDAKSFLQSQLTQDVKQLENGHAALAGYCSAQGRLLASLVLVPTADENLVLGFASTDLLDVLLKRLRMFVLRSKVSIEPRPDLSVQGWVVRADVKRAEDLLGEPLPKTAWQSVIMAQGTWIGAPSTPNGAHRFWRLATPEWHEAMLVRLSGHINRLASADGWRALDIQAGLPWIEKNTQDFFIPQMVNLDLVDGVSFSKGCYPGQEVVARAHYRGTVKRRMHLGKAAPGAEVYSGNDVYCPSEGDDPCGRIVNSAKTADGVWVLFEAPLQQVVQVASVRARALDGPELQIVDLPYRLDSKG